MMVIPVCKGGDGRRVSWKRGLGVGFAVVVESSRSWFGRDGCAVVVDARMEVAGTWCW